MKKTNQILVLIAYFLFSGSILAQDNISLNSILRESYNLTPKHSADTQCFKLQTRVLKYSLDGTRKGQDLYRMQLRCVPTKEFGGKDEYTCLGFFVQINGAPEIAVPSLKNWKYFFSLDQQHKNENKQLFGIDHSKFEQLTDERGKVIPPDNAYHIYNAFVDFHTMTVFSERTDTGKGVQDLKFVGDTVMHAASFSKPPVNLGSQVKEGSYFQNGRVTLGFKGLSLINNMACGLLNYDSGESSFYIIIKPIPNLEVSTKGTSHYWGDIYKSFATGWIQKATLQEVVISETNVPGLTNKITSIVERSIEIENVKFGTVLHKLINK